MSWTIKRLAFSENVGAGFGYPEETYGEEYYDQEEGYGYCS